MVVYSGGQSTARIFGVLKGDNDSHGVHAFYMTPQDNDEVIAISFLACTEGGCMTKQSKKADFVRCSETEDLCFLIMHPLPSDSPNQDFYYGTSHSVARVEAGVVTSIYTLSSGNSNELFSILGLSIDSTSPGFYLSGRQGLDVGGDGFRAWVGSYTTDHPSGIESICFADDLTGTGTY